MWDRSAKLHGDGRHRWRLPFTGMLLRGLMATAMWVIFALLYFGRGRVDVSTLVMAVMFSTGTALAWWSSRRSGINC